MSNGRGRWPTLSDVQRIDLAIDKLKVIKGNARAAIHQHQNVAIFVFGKDFDAKVPSSIARNTFLLTQVSLIKMLILQVCGMWDASDTNRDSLPTVRELLKDPSTLAQLERRLLQRGQNARHIVPIANNEWMIKESDRNNIAVVADRMKRLPAALHAVDKIANDPLLKSLREYRNASIAHSLSTMTRKEQDPLFGDAGRLLDKTTPIIEELLECVDATWHRFSADHDKCARMAKALWTNCEFDVLE